jgi:spore maturation protein A
MINYIWFFILAFGIIFGVLTGRGDALSKGIILSSQSTVELVVKLVGIMCLWCGVMRIAEKSGLMQKIARLLKPVLKLIFKDAARDERALGAIVMNLTANMMGLSNAATPFGIKAMEEMDRLNKNKGTASNDMALFLVLNAACIQFVPTTIIAVRVACKSQNPGIIILPAIVATGTAALMGIICSKLLQRYFL